MSDTSPVEERVLSPVPPVSGTRPGGNENQRTVDGNAAPERTVKRTRTPLTLEDKFRIAMLHKNPLCKDMSNAEMADWCNSEGNLSMPKKPDKSTISKIRTKADDHIRLCVSSPQVGAGVQTRTSPRAEAGG